MISMDPPLTVTIGLVFHKNKCLSYAMKDLINFVKYFPYPQKINWIKNAPACTLCKRAIFTKLCNYTSHSRLTSSSQLLFSSCRTVSVYLIPVNEIPSGDVIRTSILVFQVGMHVPTHQRPNTGVLPSLSGESWLAVDKISNLPLFTTSQAQPEPKRPVAALPNSAWSFRSCRKLHR